MATRIDIRPVDEAFVEEFVDVSRRHYLIEDVLDRRHIIWKHLETPTGPSRAIRLLADERPVGRIVMQKHRFLVDGAEVAAGNPIDLLIDAEHRSMQRFVALYKAMRHVEGLSFVYHTSNPTTDPIYRSLLKLPVVTHLNGFAIPVRPSHPLAKRMRVSRRLTRPLDAVAGFLLVLARMIGSRLSRIRCVPELPDDSVWGETLQSSCARQSVIQIRDAAFVRWRFLSDPVRPHELLAVRRRDQLLGYVALRHVDLFDLRFTVIVDIIFVNPLPRLDRGALIFHLCSRTRRAGSDLLFGMANIMNPDLASFFRFPFLHVPDDAMPQSTPIFVHSFDDAGRVVAQHPDAYLTLADLDLL
jgi:hypothetical protein